MKNSLKLLDSLASYLISRVIYRTILFATILLFTGLGCGRKVDNDFILVIADKNSSDVIEKFIDDLSEKVKFKVCDESSKCVEDGAINVIVEKLDCKECYQITEKDGRFVVKGGFPAGIIYGLTHFLELAGFRFPHPFYSIVPQKIDSLEKKVGQINSKVFEPAVEQRGLQLHILHPIEALFSFWIPSPEGEKEAFRIVKWIARQRGNYIQLTALDNIRKDEDYTRWKEHMKKILDYAHKIGVKVGVNIQIFSVSSFQKAYVVSKKQDLEKILSLPFDAVNISFGEFTGTTPDEFIQKVNEVYEWIKSFNKNIEFSATIHVGNFENLWVEYKGEKLLYYFLVKYANEDIFPWVHTVMSYNLFDDAGGAYNHDDFSLHREFLFEKIKQGKKVNYFPETAYWIAFDNSVPLYLPIYIVSRWIDIKNITEAGKLYSHVIFSSGWEWGYWLLDYLSLRFSWSVPVTWVEPLSELFPDWGKDIIKKLGEIQYDYLIRKRLTPYLAGEDFYVHLGCQSKVFFSQPCRITFEELVKMSDAEKQKFEKSVLEPLANMEKEIGTLLGNFPADSKSDPLILELKDGLDITYLRVKFMRNLYEAVFLYSYGKEFSEKIDTAVQILNKADEIVKRRSKNFFYPRPELLIESVENPTIYQFGYLKQAHNLCFWRRELGQAKLALGLSSETIPSCID